MVSSGVQVHSGYILAQWNDGNDISEITSASFTSSKTPLTLECGVRVSVLPKISDLFLRNCLCWDLYKMKPYHKNEVFNLFNDQIVLNRVFVAHDTVIYAFHNSLYLNSMCIGYLQR